MSASACAQDLLPPGAASQKKSVIDYLDLLSVLLVLCFFAVLAVVCFCFSLFSDEYSLYIHLGDVPLVTAAVPLGGRFKCGNQSTRDVTQSPVRGFGVGFVREESHEGHVVVFFRTCGVG